MQFGQFLREINSGVSIGNHFLSFCERLHELKCKTIIKLFLFILLFLNGAQAKTNCAQVTEIPQAECKDLLALYEYTRGDNWHRNEGWNVTNTPCSWEGVICADGFVRELNLSDNHLYSKLQTYNIFSSALPTFKALSHLHVLDLSDNALYYALYDFDFSSLTQLQYLDLSFNHLALWVPELFAPLTQLRHLNLSYNRLSDPIPELTTLTQLQKLILANNEISGLIPELTTLTQLQEINLSGNKLSGAIPNLITLTRLQIINLSENNLNCPIPDTLAQLQQLDLSHNHLNCSMPQLTELIQLQELNLSYNQLSGTIPEFTLLTQLKNLFLQNNQLNGSIPELATLTQLELLDLSENQLSGSIPTFSSLTQLRKIYLNDNQLSGFIPEFTTLNQLMTFNGSHNQLNGSIPEFTTLTQLAWLNLSYNHLTGSIPQWTTLTELYSLNLSYNHLEGSIPKFKASPALRELNLSYNQLSGPLPTFATNQYLRTLKLDHNQLCGSIPDTLTDLTHLEAKEIYLEHNHLTVFEPSVIDFLYVKQAVWQPQEPPFADCIPSYSLTVKKRGQGNGNIIANKGELNCGDNCWALYEQGSQITLSIYPDEDSIFVGWAPPHCGQTITLTNFLTCEAHFKQASKPCSAAIYSHQTQQAILPEVEIPAYVGVNSELTVVVDLYQVTLEMPVGSSHFRVKAIAFLERNPESNPCHAHFTPATGVLEIPELEIIDSQSALSKLCQATLEQSALRPEVLKVTALECQ